MLHNSTAGQRSQKRTRDAITTFRAGGERIVDLARSTQKETTAALETAVERGEVEHLVIAGGDGLVHLAVQHLAISDIPVTLVPTGTGNDFAKAIHEHAGGDSVHADLIMITETDGSRSWAASVAIAGFPAEINARANTMSRRWGSSVYAVATAFEMPRFGRQQVVLSIDDIPIRTDSAMLALGNTKYFGGGMLPCPDALPDDGLLHLTSIQDVGRLGLTPHLLARRGGSAERKEVLRGEGRRIEILSAGHEFWADGEPIGSSPLTFEIVPKALRIKEVLQTGR